VITYCIKLVPGVAVIHRWHSTQIVWRPTIWINNRVRRMQFVTMGWISRV